MHEQKLGRYTLTELIGAGSMGEVWRGHDKNLRREVAVKLLPPTLAVEKERRERFVREARLAAQLTHPNIATIYDVGVYEKQVYMAMELVDGTSLQQVVADHGPFEWKRATEIIREAAMGLRAAHEKGMVHRDVKPENLMLANTGETKVVDFGLAKARLSQTQLTQVNMVVGTPAYMSPEQWKGGEIDARSDLYSLICAYYFLLTGEPPFTADDTAALGYQHRYENLPDPRPAVARPGSVPDGVCLILQRGAAKDADARFQKADELVAALDAVLHTPTESRTFASPWNEIQDEMAENAATQLMPSESAPVIVETPRVTNQQSRLRRFRMGPVGKLWSALPFWVHVAVGFVACLVSAAIIFVVTNNGTLRIELSDPDAEVTVTIDDRISIKSSELDRPIKLRVGAHDVVIEGADYETYSKKVNIRRGQFSLVAELVEQEQDGSLQLKFSEQDKDAAVSLDIDGRERVRRSKPPRSIKLSAGNHEVIVRRTGYEDFEQTVEIEPGKQLVVPVQWEPISQAGGPKVAEQMPLKDFVVVTEFVKCEAHIGAVNDAVFSSDGKFVLSGGDDSVVRLWNATTLAKVQELKGHATTNDKGGKELVTGVALSPDRKHALSSGTDSTVRLWDLASGMEIQQLEGHKSNARDVAFSPDGIHAISSSDGFGGDPNLIYWNVEKRAISRPLRGHSSAVFPVAVSHDGAFALSGSYSPNGEVAENLFLWDLSNGTVVRSLKGHTSSLTRVGFSEDDSLLVSSSGWGSPDRVRVWNRETGDVVMEQMGFNSAAISPDGTFILVNDSRNQTFSMLSVPGGKELYRFEGHTKTGVGIMAFSPDGRTILSGGADGTIRLWRLPAAGTKETSSSDSVETQVAEKIFPSLVHVRVAGDGRKPLGVVTDQGVCMIMPGGFTDVELVTLDGKRTFRGKVGSRGPFPFCWVDSDELDLPAVKLAANGQPQPQQAFIAIAFDEKAQVHEGQVELSGAFYTPFEFPTGRGVSAPGPIFSSTGECLGYGMKSDADQPIQIRPLRRDDK